MQTKEDFSSPKNSLYTLKINKALMDDIFQISTKYQYQTYADKINETQKSKLKLYIMPRLKVKQLKFKSVFKEKPIISKEPARLKESSNQIKTLKKI